jgi:hypothetical protein
VKRRSFLGALVGAVLPLPALPLKPTVIGWDLAAPGAQASVITTGWVHAEDYVAIVHPSMAADLGLLTGYIGRYEGVRFIASRLA